MYSRGINSWNIHVDKCVEIKRTVLNSWKHTVKYYEKKKNHSHKHNFRNILIHQRVPQIHTVQVVVLRKKIWPDPINPINPTINPKELFRHRTVILQYGAQGNYFPTTGG